MLNRVLTRKVVDYKCKSSDLDFRLSQALEQSPVSYQIRRLDKIKLTDMQ